MTLNRKQQYELALAAIFHDVGKFKQRAFSGKEQVFSPVVKSMEAYLLPIGDNCRYSYRHALWTYSFFIDDLMPILKNVSLDQPLDIELIARESASHHNPGKACSYSAIISKADCLSAGGDRLMSEDLSGEGSRTKYLRTPLRSLFPNMHPSNQDEIGQSEWGYQVESAKASDAKGMFPTRIEECSCAYGELYQAFLSELSSLKGKISCANFLRKCKDLLYEYCWCIPSATNDYLNDISLYDHSVTTMSIALALGNSDNAKKPFRLLACDVSGIQSFIFQSKNQSFKGAATTIRGRSMLISALSTAYQVGLAEKLDLIPFMDILDAGGKFSILLPNYEGIEKSLEEYQEEQELFLLRKYLGTLCIVADFSMELDASCLDKKSFGTTMKDSAKRIGQQKDQKFWRAIKKNGFVLRDVDMSGNRCVACGVRVADAEGYCTECNDERMVGESLPHATTVAFSSEAKGFELLDHVWFTTKGFSPSDTVFSLGDDASLFPLWRLNNYTPGKSFEEIALTSIHDDGEIQRGKPFLGYIKIDVDHLGELFISGFPKNAFTISRYMTLSRMLNHFFNIHVHNVLASEFPDTYTVISGGDDVFLITPWDKAVALVGRLRKDFTFYCCGNPDLHFSAGIVVEGRRTPFFYANEDVNDALDTKAKEDFGRNHVCYFGEKFSYEDLSGLQNDVVTLSRFLRDPQYPVSMGFLYRMYQYIQDKLSESDARKYSSISKMRYDIARNFSGNDVDPAKKIEAIKFFNDRFEFADEEGLRRFQVAIMNAMYEQRVFHKDINGGEK